MGKKLLVIRRICLQSKIGLSGITQPFGMETDEPNLVFVTYNDILISLVYS